MNLRWADVRADDLLTRHGLPPAIQLLRRTTNRLEDPDASSHEFLVSLNAG
jgi:hypothetical protein